MPLDTITPPEPSFAEIDGLPAVDLAANLIHAQAAGRGVPGLLTELFSLMHGPGRMTPAEFFYYRLSDPALTREEKRRFVERAQVAMHQACDAVLNGIGEINGCWVSHGSNDAPIVADQVGHACPGQTARGLRDSSATRIFVKCTVEA